MNRFEIFLNILTVRFYYLQIIEMLEGSFKVIKID